MDISEPKISASGVSLTANTPGISTASTDAPRTKFKATRSISDQIEQAYYKYMYGVAIPIMDTTKIFYECKVAHATGTSIDEKMKEISERYKKLDLCK